MSGGPSPSGSHLKKGGNKGFISEECGNWVEVDKPKPAHLYANVKTHKENSPYRLIMSSKGHSNRKIG